MFDSLDDFLELFDMDAPNPLREQALDLFDRCLTEQDPAQMIAFVQRQIAQESPPMQLLREIESDVDQRLRDLRTLLMDAITTDRIARLHRDIQLAVEVHHLLADWIDALNAPAARSYSDTPASALLM